MSSTGKDSLRADFSADGRSPQGVGKPPAVLSDFDDTAAEQNVAALLLDHLGDSAQRHALRQRFRDKALTFREYQERVFRKIGASREAMKAVVRETASLRPYFKELWHQCQATGTPLAIVTLGLDFYVEALLEREGLSDIPHYSVKTRFGPRGITYQYLHPWDGSGPSTRDECSQWGNCRCSVLGHYRRQGYGILYVGDGPSDLCPASIADQVYARGRLAELCHRNGVPYTEFRDFRDVMGCLQGWLSQEWADPGPREGIG